MPGLPQCQNIFRTGWPAFGSLSTSTTNRGIGASNHALIAASPQLTGCR